ncbi:MAG: 3-dehydroquinate synthase [Abditibacteriota bacterium]|nr:3-dehydroquinate synthase [Abditibacteriota bacterium]
MTLHVKTDKNGYDVVIEPGCLACASSFLDLNRKVLIVTDKGVPEKYAKRLARQCREPYTAVIPGGEESKSVAEWEHLLRLMLDKGFSRGDCVAAVGGGVPGDLAGFAAACYMRGVDFYNIPTTVLSQVDSSIGGKTAVNLESFKNIVGAFYPPRAVLVDPSVLETLHPRHIANGLAEALKMAACFDRELFGLFENADPRASLSEIIERSLKIKRRVVEQDEKEKGLRRVLNFGHTIGHGIEGEACGLLHGECVALGMLPMADPDVRERLAAAMAKLGLPREINARADKVLARVLHDKKAAGGGVIAVLLRDVERFEFRTLSREELADRILDVPGTVRGERS